MDSLRTGVGEAIIPTARTSFCWRNSSAAASGAAANYEHFESGGLAEDTSTGKHSVRQFIYFAYKALSGALLTFHCQQANLPFGARRAFFA